MSFKICMVGCGGVAFQGHGPMLKKYSQIRDGIELAACCDLSPERSGSFAAAFGFRHAYTDPIKMLDEVKPDGAVLAVPLEKAANMAVEILGRRIPLLLEKPPGATAEEGRAIAQAARRAGVPACVAFNRRTMPLVAALIHELGESRAEILSISIEMCRAMRAEPDFSMTAIHVVDLARFLCGSDYREAIFLYRPHTESAPAADIFITGATESGAVIGIGIHPMCGVLTERVAVRLHERSYYMELPIFSGIDAPGRLIRYAGNRAEIVMIGDSSIAPPEANGFLGEYTSFFDSILQGGTPVNDVEGCLQSLEVACCIGKRVPRYLKFSQR